ncbi:MAG: Na+/H+ antiporter [Coxiella sp. RIFCSPHIGHO2_12_FULL_42_15]|nr:MAG: Na+/H+ antiporter [Coxiella sp. RIFCSPHIGHO2_12_FULL_42_15]
MDALVIIPFILFLVVICTAIAERINVPYPLLLVIAGLLVGFVPTLPNWHPPSEIVLPLFLPPILFAAARLISWQDIRNNILEITLLAFVLVVTSAIGMAFSLHALAPIFSLSTAFVLGSIISPTDSISATSILNKMNTKQRLVRSLEIESLFNDAVSITLYNMAVFFVFTGSIRLTSFTHTLIPEAIGGIAIGLLLSFFTNIIVNNFLKNSENELPIIMSFILAYVAYLFAEHIGASGVLSVVAAGLFHTHTERIITARTRLAEQASWNTYIFFLNGVIFIVIGLQFPVYLQVVKNIPVTQLIYFSLLTIAIILAFRIIWVILLALLSHLFAKYELIGKNATLYNWRDVIISSCSGMRGLVSLALAIALPLQISSTINFPNRNLIVFLTIIVILFTVVVQGLALPFIVKWLGVTKHAHLVLQETNRAYRLITERAIAHIELLEEEKKLTSTIAKKLVDNYYESRLLHFNLAQQAHVNAHDLSFEAEKWLSKILNYERILLHEMLQRGEISQEVYMRIIHKIDRDEVGFASYN